MLKAVGRACGYPFLIMGCALVVLIGTPFLAVFGRAVARREELVVDPELQDDPGVDVDKDPA